MSGGGAMPFIRMSKDGATRVMSYDGNNLWKWNATTLQWDNIFKQTNLPAAFQTLGWGLGNMVDPWMVSAVAVAVAPNDANRIYAVVCGGYNYEAYLWKSTNGGTNWTNTGFMIGVVVSSFRSQGPNIAVDPINADIVLVSDDAGAIWYTSNGFSTISCLNAPGGSLAGILPQAVTNNTTAGSSNVLNFSGSGGGTVPAAVSSPGGFTVWASDVSRNSGAGIVLSDPVASTTSTTVTLNYKVAGNNGFAGAGVSNGDTIVFGMRAGIVFDPSSSVAGGFTHGIFIGWGYGATGVYHSTDGGTSFTQISGGPPKTLAISCAADGWVYACEYNATFTGTNPWVYQPGVSWSQPSVPPPSGVGNPNNWWNYCSADPLNNGHVAFISSSGTIQFSANHGSTWYSTDSLITRTSPDVAWMGLSGTNENSMSSEMCEFDPVVAGQLNTGEGIGYWTCTPPANAAGTQPTITYTGANKGQQGLIVTSIVKPPGQPLVMTVEDRWGIRITDVTQEPTASFSGPAGSLANGWCIDYAKDNALFQMMIVTGTIRTSSDGGVSWSAPGNPAGNGGPVAVGNCSGALATMKAVWASNNSGTESTHYTADGGSTWNTSLFAGGASPGGFTADPFAQRKPLCADLTTAGVFYCYSYLNNANGGIWKSTDNGANFTRIGGTGAIGVPGGTSRQFQLISVPSNSGHLLGTGGTLDAGSALAWTGNSGSSFTNIPGATVAWLCAVGKKEPSHSYPAIYFAGTCSTDPLPNDPGVFRAIDFDPANPGNTPTWVRLCRAPAGNMDIPLSMCADLETYGTWYMGFGTGYVWGSA